MVAAVQKSKRFYPEQKMDPCVRGLTSACLLALASLSSTGCVRVAPKMPRTLSSATPINYTAAALDADLAAYHAAIVAGQLELARTDRNQIAFRTMAQIDNAYGGFELQISMRRAGVQTTGDAAQLGLTAAATVVGASAVKDILSATSTALQGARLSYDKNFFEQKTTESLISEMRASRKTLQAQMLLSLSTRDVNGYPLEAAWIDLVNYYYAGTIPSALVDIASKTGSDAVAADKSLKAVVKELTPATPEQAHQAVSIRTEYGTLAKAVGSGDPVAVAQASGTLTKILAGAGIPFDATASASDLLAALKQGMIAAADDDGKLKALNAAVQSATQP
jgi:hypothetical protein